MNTISAPAYSLIRPANLWLEIPLLLGFNLILVGLAQLSINLPFSPVPITGQTFGVLLIAMALGRVRGTAVVAAYIIEGAMGLPVFANGMAGMAVLFGPTGGYLMGFVAASWLVGLLAEHGWDRTAFRSVMAMTLGTVLIMVCGLLWLSRFVASDLILAAGLTPFIPGAIVKIALASSVLPLLWKYGARRR